jgi:hypothetical protein
MSFDPLFAAAAVLAVAGLLALVGAGALWRGRPRRAPRVAAATAAALVALVLVLAGALCVAVAVGLQGYRALTREEVAATVDTTPTGPGSFNAHFVLADGSEASYALAGDQFTVEARILKWHPWANLLGLHTAYELDRVSGRYSRLEDEQSLPRTVYPLGDVHPVDLFALRQRAVWLAPLVDAEYGSGTFTDATRRARYEVRVSTTGLLVREVR